MVKKVNGFYLTRNIKHKFLVKVRPFRSAKTRCMYDHVKPTIGELNPEHVIPHVGTNDLNTEKNSQSNFKVNFRSLEFSKEWNKYHPCFTNSSAKRPFEQ